MPRTVFHPLHEICQVLFPKIPRSGDFFRYRSVTYKQTERAQAKLDKKNNWFKSNKLPPELQPDAVLVIDASPGGEVLKIFETEIKKSKLKIRCVENPGPKHQFSAMATNHNPKNKCPPSTCLVCDTNKIFLVCHNFFLGYDLRQIKGCEHTKITTSALFEYLK